MSQRFRPSFVLASLVALIATGCGSGGGHGNADGKTVDDRAAAKPASGLTLPANGPMLLIDVEGHLSVVEAMGQAPVPIDTPAVDTGKGGVAVRAPGIAFFQTEDGGLLQVDALARQAKVIGNLEEAGGYLTTGDRAGGRRFVAFTDQYGDDGLIVDIQGGVSRPTKEFRTADDEDPNPNSVHISSNEGFLFVRSNHEIRLLALANGLTDAGTGKVLPGRDAFFNAEGTALFTAEAVDNPDPNGSSFNRVRRVPLDGGSEEVLAEKASAFLGVAGDAALIRDGDAYILTSHPGDGRKVDFKLAEGEIPYLGQTSVDGSGLASITKEDDRQALRFAWVDAARASVKHLDELDGYRGAAEPAGRFLVLSDIQLPDPGGGGNGAEDKAKDSAKVGSGHYALIDLVSRDLRTVPFDLGSHQQEVRPVPSPDGTELAVRHANDKYEFLTSIVPLDGGKPTDTPGTFLGWSPSGTGYVTARLVEAEKAYHIFIVDAGQEREIATASQKVVWTAR